MPASSNLSVILEVSNNPDPGDVPIAQATNFYSGVLRRLILRSVLCIPRA